MCRANSISPLGLCRVLPKKEDDVCGLLCLARLSLFCGSYKRTGDYIGAGMVQPIWLTKCFAGEPRIMQHSALRSPGNSVCSRRNGAIFLCGFVCSLLLLSCSWGFLTKDMCVPVYVFVCILYT